MYKVVFDDKIKKDLKKLDTQTLKALFNWIEKNLQNTTEPRLKGKALTGNKKGYWRYRIGDYRLITRIEDKKLLIIAINFKHRREVYK
jgi:addiction module toxin, relE/stbE family